MRDSDCLAGSPEIEGSPAAPASADMVLMNDVCSCCAFTMVLRAMKAETMTIGTGMPSRSN
jgi:hypothetical protein